MLLLKSVLLISMLFGGHPSQEAIPKELKPEEFAWLKRLGTAADQELAQTLDSNKALQNTDFLEKACGTFYTESKPEALAWEPAVVGLMKLSDKVAHPFWAAETRFVAGDIALSALNLPLARARFLEAASRFKAINSLRKVGLCHQNLGVIHTYTAKFDDAIKEFHIALEHLGTDRQNRAFVHQGLSNIYLRQSKNKQAYEELEKASALWVELKDDGGIGSTNLLLGNIYVREGKNKEALAKYDLAKKALSKDPSRKKELASVCMNRFAPLIYLGKIREAEAALEESVLIYKDIGDPTGEGICRFNLGSLKVEEGRYPEAVALLDAAIPLVDPETAAMAYSNIGSAYLEMGFPREALSSLAKARNQFKELKLNLGVAATETVMGGAFAAVGDIKGAIQCLENALETFPKTAKREIGVCLMNLATLRAISGQAATEFQKAIEALEGTAGQSLAYLSRSQVSYKLGQIDQALADADKGIQLSRDTDNRQNLATGLYLKGRALLKQQRTSEASIVLKEALEIVESLRPRTRDPLLTMFSLRDFDGLTADLIAASASESPVKLFEYSQRGRGYVIQQTLLGGRLPTSGLEPKDAEDYEALRREYMKTGTQKAIQALSEWELRLRSKYPKWSLSTAANPSLQAIAVALGKQGASLELLHSEDVIVGILTTASTGKNPLVSIKILSRNPREVIAESKKYMNAILTGKDIGDANFMRSSRQLYDILINPFKAELRGKDLLVICPSGSLSEVPFGALVSPEKQYLIQRLQIVEAPSTSTWETSRKVAQERLSEKGGTKLAVAKYSFPNSPGYIGGATAATPLPDLIFAPDEIKFLTGKGFIALAEKDATAKAVLRQMPKASYIHIATHSGVNPNVPMMGWLALSPNGSDPGMLYVRDITNLSLKANLAFLSSCFSITGAPTREGLLGIAWAFRVAGVPSTIATRWRLDDKFAVKWSTAFYRKHLSGTSKVASARLASLEMIRSKGEERKPKNWAAWVLFGSDI